MKGASQIAPFGLRMPEDLKDAIAERAKRNGRSMNSEIIHILEDYITPPRVEEMQPLSEDELTSPDKIQAWMKELTTKISTIEKVVKKNFPEDK
ncbi:TPA: Arc family DNA-binding protein [Yersinia enterocolitica]|nr:Arc family DNA-binding protein [Yersinia enterocolitica]HEI6761440.1 Arc family DNA-binding protein [Yersinia enterocolitica]HEI6827347.1 Arc family DNA-binding protein [Yersinia enterocolitica]HEI6868343.1 Arc family DNA-binding protein [Yersinia enterocolitica]